MNRDSRLSVALHVLLHMSGQKEAITSESLGTLMGTNPVVIRRTLAGLREAAIVRAEKGHGGGWSLAANLEALSLADVHEALGATTVFGIGVRDPASRCPIENAVNRAVEGALTRAEDVLMSCLRSVSLSDVLKAANHQATAGRRQSAKKAKQS